MKINLWASIVITTISMCIAGCDDTTTKPIIEEDWSFQPDSTKFSVSLVSVSDTVDSGKTFEVKVVFYNIEELFGASMEIAFSHDIIEILGVTTGPHFSPADARLVVSRIDTSLVQVSYGITFVAGSGLTAPRSGVVMKMRCRAKNRGVAAFDNIASRLVLKRSDGTAVPGFQSIDIEDLHLTIR
ncbi:MAG: hypothetical protein ACKVRP_05445 [Bacteroidota bacterium]